MSRVGFIGLGRMGAPMALNVLRGGHAVGVHDVRREASAEPEAAVFDISGELKGDLRAQQREMASLNTADMGGVVQNAAFDWGVVVNPKDGLAYVNDFNNGLWVVRVNPRRSRTPAIP